MRKLTNCRLYGILDLAYVARGAELKTAKAMMAGGIDVLQLRGKSKSVADLTRMAAELHKIASQSDVPLIVNDHAAVARDVPVEGVHVGQDDSPVAAVRAMAGRDLWVGKSTHSLEQAAAAEREGADYIGFGPLFATPTKPDYRPIGIGAIKTAHREIAAPIFCIGGIKLENLAKVIEAGASRVVIVSGILQAPDITAYVRQLKQMLVEKPEI